MYPFDLKHGNIYLLYLIRMINLDNKKRIKWRTQDWIWLLIVLIYSQGFAFLYNNYLMQVISYVSTFVSIALAGIAIYISIKEATNNDKMKNEIFIALSEMRFKIGDLNTKMDSFSTQELQRINSQEINEMKENLYEDLKGAVEAFKGDSEKMDEIINEKINSNTIELINNLNLVQEEYINENIISVKDSKDSLYNGIKFLKIGEEFSINDYIYKYTSKKKRFLSASTARLQLNYLRKMGYVEYCGDDMYKRVG